MTRKKIEKAQSVMVYAYASDNSLLMYSRFDYTPSKAKLAEEMLNITRDGLQKTWETEVRFEFYDERTGKSVDHDVLNQFVKEVTA